MRPLGALDVKLLNRSPKFIFGYNRSEHKSQESCSFELKTYYASPMLSDPDRLHLFREKGGFRV